MVEPTDELLRRLAMRNYTECQNPELERALATLRKAVLHAYAEFAKQDAVDQEDICLSEMEQREIIVNEINEDIPGWRKFSQFNSVHLDLLALLISFWRECEVEGEILATT